MPAILQVQDRPSGRPCYVMLLAGDLITYFLLSEIRRATVLDTHRLNVGDDIGGHRIIRIRPESTREVGHVDVVQITEDD